MLIKSRQRAERFISWLFKLAAGGRQRRRAELAQQAPVEVRRELVSAVIPYSTARMLPTRMYGSEPDLENLLVHRR